jgi:hypothetical protein
VQYHDGTPVKLGDRVRAAIPGGSAPARIVMLGETYEHLNIDPKFLSWVERDRVLEPAHVVLEWIEKNPFAHEDPNYAPVGNYMFSPLDSAVTRDV